MKFNLHELAAFAVFSFVSNLKSDWISNGSLAWTLNERKDYLSKIADYDDWEITTQ